MTIYFPLCHPQYNDMDTNNHVSQLWKLLIAEGLHQVNQTDWHSTYLLLMTQDRVG